MFNRVKVPEGKHQKDNVWGCESDVEETKEMRTWEVPGKPNVYQDRQQVELAQQRGHRACNQQSYEAGLP